MPSWMPASPETTTRRPRPPRASASASRSRASGWSRPRSADPEAYTLYLQAAHLTKQSTQVGYESALGLLSQALGSREGECNPDVSDYLLVNDDQLLLCTDGLTDMVDDADIELVLNSATSSKSACSSLVDLALKNGGRDNVTVVVARYSIPD